MIEEYLDEAIQLVNESKFASYVTVRGVNSVGSVGFEGFF